MGADYAGPCENVNNFSKDVIFARDNPAQYYRCHGISHMGGCVGVLDGGCQGYIGERAISSIGNDGFAFISGLQAKPG